MYKLFYDLSEKPFQINTDPHFLWLGANHREALATLDYGLSSENGFLLMTGDVGAGKTTLINALLKNLDEYVLVANVSNPKLDLMDFLNHVAQSLGIERQFDNKVDFLFYFQEFLQKINLDHKRILLIIDEAQKLSVELLEEIRLLSNVEQPEQKIVNIFFVGQNELNETLKSSECRALRQRITLNYNVKPLSEAETPQYIKHRLKVAGTEARIFKQKAIREIHSFSGGYPRLINIICDRALLTGYVNALNKITPDIIRECAQELLLPGETKEDLFPNSPQPLIPDIPAPAVEDLSTKEKDLSFHETESTSSPLMGSQAFYGATSSRNKAVYQHTWESVRNLKNKGLKYAASAGSFAEYIWESVLDLKDQLPKYVASGKSFARHIWESVLDLKELSLEHAATVSSSVKLKWKTSSELNKRRMKYGIVAGPLIITAVVVASYNDSIPNSNQDQPTSQELSTSAPVETDEKDSSSLSMIAFEQAVVDSTIESDNGEIESQFASTSDQHNPAPQELSTLAPKESDSSIPSPEMEAREQDIASSVDKAVNTRTTDESKPAELFLTEQAREELARNNFSRAAELLEDDLAQQEEIKELYVQSLRGQAGLLLKEDTDQAKNLLNKAAKVDPQNAMVWYDLGKLYTHTKDYSKAIESYLIAADLDPASADTFFNLGFNYAAVKDYVHAEKMFQRATELEPPYLDEAIFNLAMVQYKQGKKQQCVENLEKAIKVNPENQRAHKYLNRFKIATAGSQ
jgi:type II secretory pathway predicted ATPase ExeA/Flp pilus assembly protein TadD